MKRMIPLVLIISVVIFCCLLQGCSFLNLENFNNLILPDNELSAEELYELLSPSVVEITGNTRTGTNTGTGFFYDNRGTVITNYHVIEDCVSAKVTLSNGKSYDVENVMGYSEEKDIAILSTSCNDTFPLEIRTEAVKTGETVYAIGSSLGLSGSLSNGIISSSERMVNGHKYIQTTAPISHGNSGGPLIDKEGRVVGITSASLTDGQNLNLAIPIGEVASISTKEPVLLVDLFKSNVEWLLNWEFIYYDDENSYVLLFELADKNEIPMASAGTVEILIVNDADEILYEARKTFGEEDFSAWTKGENNEYYYASVYISPDEILPSTSSYGTVYFEVYGDKYFFEQETIAFTDFPVKPVEVILPLLPITVDDYGYGSDIETTVRIDSITYESVYGDSLYIYFSGEKIYDVDGISSDSWCSFEWKLYDWDGYLIDKGTFYTDCLSVGDKFKEKYVFVSGGIKPGEQYKFVIFGAKESERIEFESYYVGLRTISLPDKKTAEKIVEEWRNSDATEEAMITLMNEYGSGQGGGQLYLVQPGEFIEEVDTWCFDRNRKVGDIVIIETEYGYTICYFSSIIER